MTILLYIIYRIFLKKVVKTVKKTALSQHFMFYDKSCSLIRYSLDKYPRLGFDSHPFQMQEGNFFIDAACIACGSTIGT